MVKQLMLNVKLLKDYYIFMLFPLVAIIFGALERGAALPQVNNDNVIFATSLGDFVAGMTCFICFSMIFQKQYNLKKFKLNKWYFTLPISKQNLILSEIIFVALSHFIGILFWSVYLLIKGTPGIFGMMLMPYAVSLMICSIYLIFFYRFGDEVNLTVGIMYSLNVAVTLMFHSFIVRNDYEMGLKLSNEAGWNFYLYQLPYIALVMGVILLVAAYFIINRNYHRKHQFA